jgi:hypothetical protein
MQRSFSRSLLVTASAATITAAMLAACAGGMSGSSGSSSGYSAGGTSGSSGMGFFVSSRGSGRGGDLGGLSGADQLCSSLASAAGAGNRTWRAYLSTPSVNARDRIGTGPWRNAKGVVVANNVTELHGANNINKQTALTEKGDVVNGRGDTPNMHDILTGSQPDGTAIKGGDVDTTCGNWTKSGEGAAMLGHHDRTGLDESAPAKSWNSSHQSRGCSIDALKSTGGDGRIYCFAAN